MTQERMCCVMSKRKEKFLEFYNSVVGQRGYSAARVREEISRYCHIPEGTFNETVNIKKSNLNPLVVLAFCKTYGFDIDDIYQDEGFVKQKAPFLPTQADMGVVDPELPDEFQGRFFGCFIAVCGRSRGQNLFR